MCLLLELSKFCGNHFIFAQELNHFLVCWNQKCILLITVKTVPFIIWVDYHLYENEFVIIFEMIIWLLAVVQRLQKILKWNIVSVQQSFIFITFNKISCNKIDSRKWTCPLLLLGVGSLWHKCSYSWPNQSSNKPQSAANNLSSSIVTYFISYFCRTLAAERQLNVITRTLDPFMF